VEETDLSSAHSPGRTRSRVRCQDVFLKHTDLASKRKQKSDTLGDGEPPARLSGSVERACCVAMRNLLAAWPLRW